MSGWLAFWLFASAPLLVGASIYWEQRQHARWVARMLHSQPDPSGE
jgi:hypothetical protein